jgi:hypothetical protein
MECSTPVSAWQPKADIRVLRDDGKTAPRRPLRNQIGRNNMQV